VLLRTLYLIGVLTTVTCAQDLAEARRLYLQAIDGDRAAAERASTAFAALEKTDLKNPVIQAYSGSLLLLESSRAFAPWKKGKLAKEGLKRMDNAVTAAPKNVEVRFIRAASTRELPGFFKRGGESEADFALLAPNVASAVRAGKLEPRLGSAALYNHALNLERGGKIESARQACQTAVEIGANTSAAKACATKTFAAQSR
jgi:hypothetical protein